MFVADYETKFSALTCFAPNLVTDEEARIRRFQNGLDESIWDMVMAEPCEMYGKAVDRAMWAEKAVAQFSRMFVKRKGEEVKGESSSKKQAAQTSGSPGRAISAEKLVIGQTTVPMEWCVTGVVCRDIPLISVLRQVHLVHSNHKTRIGQWEGRWHDNKMCRTQEGDSRPMYSHLTRSKHKSRLVE
ncbi:hypothetical protein ACLOJK_024113 [Asimina triloba]